MISEAVHALYRQMVLDQVRRETAALADDPDEQAEIRNVHEDLEYLRQQGEQQHAADVALIESSNELALRGSEW